MNELQRRQGVLVSVILHLAILSVLTAHRVAPVRPRSEREPDGDRRDVVVSRLFLPPREVLRQIPPAPRPAQPTPAPSGKDRISIGPPSTERSREPLVLRREEDLGTPKGRPEGGQGEGAEPVEEAGRRAQAAVRERDGSASPDAQAGEPLARAGPGPGPRPGLTPPSIASSLRRLEERQSSEASRGLPGGTGRSMGPLFFDPQGADFTAWINHFKNEVYRNWVLPQAVLFGYSRGHVDFEFTVARDGSIVVLRLVKSSGTASLDRAAHNALTGSRLLALPADYGPPQVTMQVSFFYNEAPSGA
jgi:TonB family protein